MTIYLVRHAHAGSRSAWVGDDTTRPLSPKGQRQTEAITELLADSGATRILTSAYLRCRQTVEPLAARLGVEVEDHEALREGAKVADTTNLIWRLATKGTTAVLSSHGDVIPAALDALRRDGVAVDTQGLPKGTLYELDVRDGAITTARFVDPRPLPEPQPG